MSNACHTEREYLEDGGCEKEASVDISNYLNPSTASSISQCGVVEGGE